MKFNVDKADKEKRGIYIITNKVDERVYIGQAQNFYRRYLDHRANLKAGTHANPLLQNFVLEFSIDELEFSVLEITRLLARETHYIEEYKAVFVGYGFNIARCDIQTSGFDEKFRLNSLYLHYIKKGHQQELNRLEGMLGYYKEHFKNLALSNQCLTQEAEDAQYDAILYRNLYETMQEDRNLWKQRWEMLTKQNVPGINRRKKTMAVQNQLSLFACKKA
jgi:hypothetical protein